MLLSGERVRSRLVTKVEEMSGQRVLGCYQCGKCTAGCPMASFMDPVPHGVMRLLQLGQVSRAMRTAAVWMCASCHSCASRCPRGVDLARVMESLRLLILRGGEPKVRPEGLPAELLMRAPQQALVSCARKYQG